MERKNLDRLKKLKDKWKELGKLRYALLAVFIGILILSVPTEKTAAAPMQTEGTEKSIETRMEEILSMVHGAGNVRVMLTKKNEGYIEYQTDIEEFCTADETERRTETVFGAQDALVKSKSAPVYLGAVIVCDGADRPTVCLELVNAACSLTGLTSDKITVLKMKE